MAPKIPKVISKNLLLQGLKAKRPTKEPNMICKIMYIKNFLKILFVARTPRTCPRGPKATIPGMLDYLIQSPWVSPPFFLLWERRLFFALLFGIIFHLQTKNYLKALFKGPCQPPVPPGNIGLVCKPLNLCFSRVIFTSTAALLVALVTAFIITLAVRHIH